MKWYRIIICKYHVTGRATYYVLWNCALSTEYSEFAYDIVSIISSSDGYCTCWFLCNSTSSSLDSESSVYKWLPLLRSGCQLAVKHETTRHDTTGLATSMTETPTRNVSDVSYNGTLTDRNSRVLCHQLIKYVTQGGRTQVWMQIVMVSKQRRFSVREKNILLWNYHISIGSQFTSAS